jgi:hypothetical protein
MTEASNSAPDRTQTAFEYRLQLVAKLSKRWDNYCHEYDQLAVKDWEGSKPRRLELIHRMNEVSVILRDFLPWIEP